MDLQGLIFRCDTDCFGRDWSDDKGICWARVLKDVPDLDDTSMAFRLLRQHGYNVSAGTPSSLLLIKPSVAKNTHFPAAGH